MSWVVEALTDAHRRSGFRCGNPSLDAYLERYAGQHARKDLGRTFVATQCDSRDVFGYYTLCSSSVSFEYIPERIQRKLPMYPLPTALVGKLAVDMRVQRQGLGAFLLLNALHRIVDAASQMAIFAVEVHAVDVHASGFYRKYGFQPFRDQPLHLFLPIDTIRQVF